MPKRGVLRLTGGLLLLVAAILGGGLAYLQTGDGFVRALLPLVSGLSGFEITARSGQFDLDGHLEAEELRFRDPAIGLDIVASRIELELSIESLLSRSDLPHIKSGVVRNAIVSLDSTAGEKTTQGTKRTQTSANSGSSDLFAGRIEIPVRIDRAEIEALTLRLLDGDKPRNVIGPLNSNFTDLAPLAAAQGTLTTPLALAMEAGQPGYSGRLQATLHLEQDRQGVVRGMRLNGDLALARTHGEKESGLAISVDLDANSHEASTLAATLTAQAKRNGRDTGELASTWHWHEADSGTAKDPRRSLIADLDLTSLELVNLNPFLAAIGGAQFHGGKVDAKFHLTHPPNGPLGLSGNLDAHAIALTLDSSGSDTPALDVHAKQEISWNRHTSILSVSRADLDIVGRHGRSLQIALEDPLEMDLDLANGDPAPGQSAKISVELERIDIAGVRRWLRALRVDSPDAVEDGHIGIDVEVEVNGRGARLGTTGTVEARSLRIQGVEGELDLHSEIDLKVEDYERFHLDHAVISLNRGSSPLLKGRLSGENDPPTGTWNAAVQIEASDLMKAMAPLPLLSADLRKRIHGGNLDGRFTLKSTAPGTAEVAGKLAVKGIALEGAAPKRGLSIDLDADLRALSSPDDLAIRELNLAFVEPAGRPLGSLASKGNLALASSEKPRASQITVSTKSLHLAPWIEALTDFDASLGDLPLTASIEFTNDAAKDVLRSKGQETFEVIPEGAINPFTAHASHQIEVLSTGGMDFEIELKIPRKKGPPDAVKFHGKYENHTGRKVTAPSLTVAANVESLDLTPYLSSQIEKSSQRERGSQPPVPVLPSGQENSDPEGQELVLDIHAKIDQARFSEIAIESSELRLSRDPSRLKLDVNLTETTGGSLKALLDHRRTKEMRSLSWNLSGTEIDVGKLMRSIAKAGLVENTAMNGTLAVSSSVRGSGKTPEGLRRNLTGQLNTTLSNSHISDIPVLDMLSRTTGISAFEGILLSGCRVGGRIENDAFILSDSECTGDVATLQATGRIGLDGRLDLMVSPRLGPSFQGALGKVFRTPHLTETAGGFIALPIDILVEGPVGQEHMSVRARVPGALDKLTLGTTSKVLDTTVKIGSGLLEMGGALLKVGSGSTRDRP
ncbi:AsmA-like C-terminal region-containing protein [Myxococcota bacterium]|nr:AsmA-like C-terminal region-containing protein [Myxococcota bacterium]